MMKKKYILTFFILSLIGSAYSQTLSQAKSWFLEGKFAEAKPVFKKLPGWKCDIRGIKKYEDLPENCRKYIEFVEEQIGYPITMVSNGPGREDIIYRNK